MTQARPQHPPLPDAGAPGRAQSVRHLPVGLFGSVMSIAGLSLAWRIASKQYGIRASIADGIGIVALIAFAVLVVAYLAKTVKHPEAVAFEFTHPVLGSFFGTVGISILLLSSVLGRYNALLHEWVWLFGTLVTLGLSVVMISRLFNGNMAPTSVAPAWLIAGVGSLDVVVAGGQFTSGWGRELNLFAAAVGGVSALVFFVLIFSRLVHEAPLTGATRPSKMILTAPFSVGFIAYVNLSHHVDMFAALLFYFALFLFAVIAYRLITRPAPFSPTWWGIGFPMAALTNASLIYADAVGGAGLTAIAAIMLTLLSAAVAVLAVRTLHALATGRLLAA
ncbi:C4-dicarboxylate ABC transporter [Pandoraea capi]|uniref:C4-dicarboxylate ABC transporter n=1 Tax=Pandoraea capi TaxID=2508286 RepID=A0ABY6W9E5_9BURK|nr:SLAC1 anion channel family protein [Pandoraea capi]VVE42920.1 C4-dicarboxylate ABC transporter [Pandoraea capi]